MWRNVFAVFFIIATYSVETKERQRRYLLFTKATQWGVFATVSIPIHPETLVSAAWFFEANYYNVDNATYFEPLLGDIETTARKKRHTSHHLTRRHLYTVIESMLERHGYPGRPCLLRAICENAASDPQNGVLGDLLHLALTFFIIATYSVETKERQRRYLLFTKATQWGVFATVSIPIHPETLVSAAWFFEANYYNVDNATYFEPLLGDIETTARKKRHTSHHLTRRHLYTVIESMLERHGYPGRPCLLRAICENAASDPQNGVLGDLLHLALTPSTSMAEDIEDCYYEAEFWGSEGFCYDYVQECSNNPLDLFSLLV